MCIRDRLGVYPSKCMTKDKCSWCLRACPEKEHSPIHFDEDGVLAGIDRTDACRGCLKCADVCPGRAIKAWGEEKTVSQLMKIIEGDRPFYEKTGGGVTLNGGEVLVQWEFAAMLLKACKEAGINTCVETALHVPPEHVKAILDYTDLIITDIAEYELVPLPGELFVGRAVHVLYVGYYEVGVVPVSYTHLDVYKRQVSNGL